MSEPALLRVGPLRKEFSGAAVLRGVELEVRAGEFMTLLGPSGCGKTTTLRVIAGFESPDSGRVILGGRDVTELPPYERDVHTVFQHYALFPHHDVLGNVAFGLRLRRLPEAEVRARAAEALALVKLGGFEPRRISSLSGGQQQRVALARAIAGRPSLLLLDEPLGALDEKLRRQMQLELKSLQRRLGIAFVYVTHDQVEAMSMSDRVAVFRHGQVAQVGAPAEIYDRPRTPFVADFVGGANILDAEVLASESGGVRLRLEGAREAVVPAPPGRAAPAPGPVRVAIRPELVRLRAPDEPGEGGLRWEAAVEESAFQGGSCLAYLRPFPSSPETLLCAAAPGAWAAGRLRPGARAAVEFLPADLRLLEPDAP